MSSATSTESEAVHAREPEAGSRESHDPRPPTHAPRSSAPADDSALRPWQFFLLAGMLCATAVVIVATGQSPASIVILSLTVVAASLVALGTHRALAPLVLPESVLRASTLIGGRSRAGLEREKTLVLRTIKELEFDFAMGKISRTDYDDMGGRLRARAMGLIRQLDAGAGYKGAIEQELQIRIAEGGTEVPPGSHAGRIAEGGTLVPPGSHAGRTEVLPSTRAGGTDVPPSSLAIEPTAVTTCPSCGVTNDPDARFCKNCGTKLSV